MLLQTQLTLKTDSVQSICKDEGAMEQTLGNISGLQKEKDQNFNPFQESNQISSCKKPSLLTHTSSSHRGFQHLFIILHFKRTSIWQLFLTLILCIHASIYTHFPKTSLQNTRVGTETELQNQLADRHAGQKK